MDWRPGSRGVIIWIVESCRGSIYDSAERPPIMAETLTNTADLLPQKHLVLGSLCAMELAELPDNFTVIAER